MPIDPELLDRVERETLFRINTTRHVLLSQLGAAQLSVTRAVQHARAHRLDAARAELKEASGILYAATETTDPVAALVQLLGGTL